MHWFGEENFWISQVLANEFRVKQCVVRVFQGNFQGDSRYDRLNGINFIFYWPLAVITRFFGAKVAVGLICVQLEVIRLAVSAMRSIQTFTAVITTLLASGRT